MHIHTVFFWLWKTLSDEEWQRFEQGLDLLTRDPNVLGRHIGKPAGTNRPVIDSSYDYCIVLHFDNLAAHNAYQAGKAHQDFLDGCASFWSRVQVYDIEASDVKS